MIEREGGILIGTRCSRTGGGGDRYLTSVLGGRSGQAKQLDDRESED